MKIFDFLLVISIGFLVLGCRGETDVLGEFLALRTIVVDEGVIRISEYDNATIVAKIIGREYDWTDIERSARALIERDGRQVVVIEVDELANITVQSLSNQMLPPGEKWSLLSEDEIRKLTSEND